MRGGPVPLQGRDAEIALLDTELERARRGLGRLLLVEGEPGSGKSRILSELAARATGSDVFTATAREIERDRPFGAIGEALAIRAGATGARAEIASLLRSDAEQHSGLRFRIADDIADLVERLALERPLLIAIDDLQWADDSTVLTLHVIARRSAHLPVLVAAAFRPVPVPAGLADLELAASENGARLRLGPLDDGAVAAIAHGTLGLPPGPSLRALLADAGGNPFFVTELLAAIEEEGSVQIREGHADVASAPVSPELRVVILRRLGSLSRDTIDLLRLAAVLGSVFTVADLATVLAVPPASLLPAIDEAIAAAVLDPGEQLRFRHDLVREALYADIPRSARDALHVQAGRALASAGAPAELVATHFAAGAAAGDAEAATWLRRAARGTAGASPATVTKWLRRALDLLPEGHPLRDEVIGDLAPALVMADPRAADAIAREALGRPQPADRRVVLRKVVAEVSAALGKLLEAADVYEQESRAEDLSEIQRVRLAAYAVEGRAQRKPFETEQHAKAVLARAEATEDAEAIVVALAALFAVEWWRGDIHAAVRFAERGFERARSDPALLDLGIGILLAMALVTADRGDDARVVINGNLARAESRGLLVDVPRCLNQLAQLETYAGRWDDALAHAEASLRLTTELGMHAASRGGAELFTVQLSARRGELDRARAVLDERVKRAPKMIDPQTEPWFKEASGEPDVALDMLRRIAKEHIEGGHTRSLLEYATQLVRLEMESGEPARAAKVAEAVEGAAPRMDTPWADAVALHARGYADFDAERMLDAVKRARASSRRVLFAEIAHDAGVVLARAGRTDEAVSLHTEALGFFEAAGATWDVARIEAALRALGVRRGKRGPRGRPKTGWDSLTDTERRVVELATQGLTNAEVGARMFLSGRTVERHLTHVYGKLGIASRVELAAAAARARG